MNAYVGMCAECNSVKLFDSERDRDLWSMFHPHLENYEEVPA